MKALALGASVALALGWSGVRHLQLPVGPNRLHWGGLVFGHRGCRHVPGIPENTLDAFKYAASRGCGGVECDVRLTKDNELVVFHDAYINGVLRDSPFTSAAGAAAEEPGTTGPPQREGRRSPLAPGAQRRRVSDLTLFELKALSFLEDPTHQIRVPTLEESILFCRENKLKLLIEIKELRKPRLCTDKVLDLYRRYPDYMYSQTTLIAFFPNVLYYARSRDGRVAVGQISSGSVFQSALDNPNQHDKRLPFLVRACPKLADSVLLFVQERITPWVAGCSLVCPHYKKFAADPQYKKRWLSRKIGVYLWGFERPEQCTVDMRGDGCFVSADDAHEQYTMPKPAPNYDIFGEREREEERRRQPRLR